MLVMQCFELLEAPDGFFLHVYKYVLVKACSILHTINIKGVHIISKGSQEK